eukprot:3424847-Rhodomonas_salina.2
MSAIASGNGIDASRKGQCPLHEWHLVSVNDSRPAAPDARRAPCTLSAPSASFGLLQSAFPWPFFALSLAFQATAS